MYDMTSRLHPAALLVSLQISELELSDRSAVITHCDTGGADGADKIIIPQKSHLLFFFSLMSRGE